MSRSIKEVREFRLVMTLTLLTCLSLLRMTTTVRASDTPLMKQYNAIKAKYPGALLLFRVGDFYETFGEDALKASKVLDIVLTRRANGAASEVELAGFPHHALDAYLPRLVRAGYRVAICDQLEDPRMVKGIVKRGVTELVTPGVSFNDHVLDKKQNNFLASVFLGRSAWGVSFLDISTGEFHAAQGPEAHVMKLIQNFTPAEIIFCRTQRDKLESVFSADHATFTLDDWAYSFEFAEEKLLTQFKVATLKGFGLDGLHEAVIAAGAVIQYLESTEHNDIHHIASISRIDEDQYVWLDHFTIRNLEIVRAQQDGGVPLLEILDRTLTPMGSRLMRKWILLPLRDKAAIDERLNCVATLSAAGNIGDGLSSHFRQIADLERLISKVAVGRINPREMLQLKRSLRAIVPVKELLLAEETPGLKKIGEQLSTCDFLLEKIEKELRDDAPMLTHGGGIIRDGVNAELDELRKLAYTGKDYVLQIQKREVQRTGITSLKVAYNKVFGYYLEVSNANKDKVPADWIRKQTLVNAERYITEELKVYEERILHAEEKLVVLEQQLFRELVRHTADFVSTIQQNARLIATLDCLLSFSNVARTNRYARPAINESKAISIKEGRHPVVEQQLPPGETYVPNDIELDNETQQILIITGPNMAGKSALLRQTALIVLMAQMGSFVPASEANIGLVDKVFTRVGASDNLSRGESTFMVEMTETASILNNLNDRSLVLMDEIGRGTSTYDGVSMAWSIVEYLHDHAGARPKTLFATHYHELNQLEDDLERVRNYNVSVKEAGDKIIFLRKLKPGGSEHSFGIHVAQLAGMPNRVVFRANEVLHFLEKEKERKKSGKEFGPVPKTDFQMSLFEMDPRYREVQSILDKIDINTISPVEALLKLNEILTLLRESRTGS